MKFYVSYEAVIGYYSSIYQDRLRKIKKTLNQESQYPAKIQTRSLCNISLKCYCYINPLGTYDIKRQY